MEEVDTTKIKTLERITVAGLQGSKRDKDKEEEDIVKVNVVLFNGNYYCIDDPIILEGQKKVKINLITEVSSINELYSLYIENNTRNAFNPYKLLLLYKHNKFSSSLPKKIKDILVRNQHINDELLITLNEHLLKIEEKNKGKPIFISLTVLDAISRLLEYIEKLSREELLRIIDEYIADYEDESYIQYPTPQQLESFVQVFFLEEEEEKKKEEVRKHIEELRKQKMQGAKVEVYEFTFPEKATTEEVKARLIELIEKVKGEEKITEPELEHEHESVIVTTPTSTSITVDMVPTIPATTEVGRGEGNNRKTATEPTESQTTILTPTTTTMDIILLTFKLRVPHNEEVKQQIQKAVVKFLSELKRLGVIVDS